MIKPHSPVVLIHNRECRAVDLCRINVESGSQTFGKDCFARAQIALQQKDCGFRDALADLIGQFESLFGGMGDELAGWNHLWLHPSTSL